MADPKTGFIEDTNMLVGALIDQTAEAGYKWLGWLQKKRMYIMCNTQAELEQFSAEHASEDDMLNAHLIQLYNLEETGPTHAPTPMNADVLLSKRSKRFEQKWEDMEPLPDETNV